MNYKNPTKDIVLVAFLTATLVVGKLALMFLPNVECVTFLIVLYTACLGFKRGGVAAILFVVLDGVIFGFGVYTISYFLQFPTLALVVALVSRKGIKSEYTYTVVAFIMVVFFGVHTSVLDTLFFGGAFWARYAGGLLFYAANILSACALTLFAFKPLSEILQKQLSNYYKKGENPKKP